jgi:2-succinyl-5-enolpyruvyl-6-hydroxy-3-cyclohexene-1-carboxylate synthase
MPHSRQHITDLAGILKKRNIERIVISPGSRSAPLINAFTGIFGDRCVSIVDERSAAYFALGIAISTRQPVAMICTSGTAVLNYAPAIAEAYYQQVPLIAITADRPHEWIDQFDNQTLRQKGIYNNFIKRSFELPQFIATNDDLWFAQRIVNDAVNVCLEENPGPVHINVPLTEPLYDELPPTSEELTSISRIFAAAKLELPASLISEWKKAERIMIIHGQDHPLSGILQALQPFLKDPRIIIMAENISNLCADNLIMNSNLLLSLSRGVQTPEYPDLIIHSGGQVVSKALTGYLRKGKGIKCWRIGKDNAIIDTFRQVSFTVPYSAVDFYRSLGEHISPRSRDNYRQTWLKQAKVSEKLANERISKLPFSDIHVFSALAELMPTNASIVLGNSSIIRYSQIFRSATNLKFYSNRGVSGIDGALSTASGIASTASDLTIAILGDLGFLYDSNALWNNALPGNLRIVVVNNQGGGIFHILKGPSDQPGFKKFIEAHHPVNIAKLAEAYGLRYSSATNKAEMLKQWPDFVNGGSPAIFEIKTDAAISASSFRQLMAANDK